MRTLLFTANAVLFSSLTFFATPAEARQKISLKQAEEVCLKRAIRFNRSSMGRDSGSPPPDIVDHRYRICVHSKSGQNPQRKLKVRGNNVTLN